MTNKRHEQETTTSSFDPLSKQAKYGRSFPHAFSPPQKRSKALLSLGSHTADGLFEELHVRHYVHVHPHDIHCLGESFLVDQFFKQMLFKFYENFGGIPVHIYEDSTEIIKDFPALFIHDSPWAHLYVCAKWLVFTPKKGHVLLGTINKMTLEHIGVLVLGYFNASINDLSGYTCIGGNTWTNGTNTFALGQNIEFTVTNVQTSIEGLLTIQGSLKCPETVSKIPLTSKISPTQYGDHFVLGRTPLDASSIRKRIKKLSLPFQ